MIDTLKASVLITLLFAALMTIVFLATPSYAGPVDGLHSAGAIKTAVTLVPMTIAGRSGTGSFATPGQRVKKPCGGQTTSQCCKGLSKCSCLYMPGSSSNNHPTACFATKTK